jgi:hypothetical protein
MNLIGKRFQNKSGKICTIKDINEQVTTFDDNTRVETKYLLDKKYFVEMPSNNFNSSFGQTEKIDPNHFLNNQRNPILEQIRSLSTDIIDKLPPDNMSSRRDNFYPTDNSFAVLPEDPEMERQELEKKYNINSSAVTNNAIEQANAQMNRLLNDPKWGKMISEEMNYQPQSKVTQQTQAVVQQTQPVVQTKNDNYDYQPQTRQVDPVVETKYQQQSFVDPIVSMFQKAKRTTNFKISLDIEKKIPRLDFIEMMEDSYETSIIDYLAQEFTEQILSNPNLIKTKISDEIRNMLYKKANKSTRDEIRQVQDNSDQEVIKKITPKGTPKKSVIKTEDKPND